MDAKTIALFKKLVTKYKSKKSLAEEIRAIEEALRVMTSDAPTKVAPSNKSLSILDFLRRSKTPITAGAIANHFQIGGSTTTTYLRSLQEGGLVNRSRVGNQIVWGVVTQIAPPTKTTWPMSTWHTGRSNG